MKNLWVLTLLLVSLVSLPGHVHAESLDTVSGIVSEDGQLFGSNGVIYEIAENEIGLELMEMTGNRVRVQGKVVTKNDSVIIVVVDYEVTRK